MNANTLFAPHLGKVAMKEAFDEGLIKHKENMDIQDNADEIWATSHTAGNCYWKVKIERKKAPMLLH
ncbi:hypothetical protein I6M48_21045 [Shewanella algae]|uniref:hypothetical protein n=1 Tax=Shewanella algae TaxID=38313 RepID=UPI001AAFD0E9|nr:hypothetical protein [Shewanella algae]MBO2634962.1 hypothetical protein [Shewanella algae]